MYDVFIYFYNSSGLRVLLITMFKIWMWERRGTSVVSHWAEVVQEFGDKKAFIMGDRSLTFREVRHLVLLSNCHQFFLLTNSGDVVSRVGERL